MEEKGNAEEKFLDTKKGQSILKGVEIGVVALSLAVSTAALIVVLTMGKGSSSVTHLVNFRNYDSALLSYENVEDGKVATDPDLTPIKPADSDNTYSFIGWDQDINTTITQDMTFTATYSATPIEKATYYNVRFLNDDNIDDTKKSVLYTCSIKSGEKASYQGVTPTKASDANYSYTFKGWDIDPSSLTITSNKDFVAQYNQGSLVSPTISYAVRFLDENSNVLFSANVNSGSKACYGGLTPTKASSSDEIYEFAGWDKSLNDPITQNTDFIVKFDTYYEVTFLNYDGSLIDKQIVKKGLAAATPSITPKKGQIEYTAYTFKSWESGSTVFSTSLLIDTKISFTAQYTTAIVANSGIVFTPDNTTSPTQYSVTGYTGNDDDIYIPSTHNELPVTSIGYGAFSSSRIVTIKIPSVVKTFGTYSFGGCKNLVKVSIDSSSQLTTIGSQCFFDCKKLSYFSCPESVVTIGNGAFSHSGISSFCCESPTMTIEDEAFSNSALVTFEINQNSSVTAIPNYCFADCLSLVSCEFEDDYSDPVDSKITTIGKKAFDGCINLDASNIINESTLTTVGDYSFRNCNAKGLNLKDYTFSALESIGEGAFENSNIVAGLKLTYGLQVSVGDDAFYKSSVTSLYTSTGDITIGNNAFKDVINLVSVHINSSGANFAVGDYAFANCVALSSLIFEQPFVSCSIGDYAFYNCNLTSSLFVSHCTLIGDGAFQGAWDGSIDSDFFDGTFSAGAATSVGDEAFIFCPIKTYSFGSLTTIGERAFYGSAITTSEAMWLAQGTRYYPATIEKEAFACCCNLTNIDLTSASTSLSIGEKTFANIGSITTLKLPNTITISGTTPFYGDSFGASSVSYAGTNSEFSAIVTTYNSSYSGTSLLPSGTSIACSDTPYVMA